MSDSSSTTTPPPTSFATTIFRLPTRIILHSHTTEEGKPFSIQIRELKTQKLVEFDVLDLSWELSTPEPRCLAGRGRRAFGTTWSCGPAEDGYWRKGATTDEDDKHIGVRGMITIFLPWEVFG